jgi:hypothetical protein
MSPLGFLTRSSQRRVPDKLTNMSQAASAIETSGPIMWRNVLTGSDGFRETISVRVAILESEVTRPV